PPRDRALREQLERRPDVRLPRPRRADAPAVAPPDERPCFPIHRIELRTPDGAAAGRFAFALDALPDGPWRDPAVEPPCLGVRGVNAAVQRLQHAIVERGLVTTRVLAEPQDLSAGTLALTVVPGLVRAVRIEAAEGEAAADAARATVWNALPTGPGRLLDLRDLEQGLENWKRVPTADAAIRIAPGDAPGESDLLVQWRQPRAFRASVGLDDAGSRATGRQQASVTFSGDHWARLNDLFYASISRGLGGDGRRGGRGSDSQALHYSLPWGYALLAFDASAARYRQTVAGATQDYVYAGSSRNAGAKLSWLVHRDASSKSSVFVRGWTRSSNNSIDDTEVEVQRRRTAGWEAGVTQRRYLGDATLEAALAHRRGTGAFGALPAPEEAFGEGSSRPRITTADAQFDQPFTLGDQRLRYRGALRAQWHHTPLVPQDRFSIGNRYTVRGFDGETTLAAERGWFVRNELGWAFADLGLETYAGLDHGRVGGASAANLPGTQLTGAVLGLRGSAWRTSADLFVGAPIRKPDGFRTAGATAGFNLQWSY
ncbi:MAG TPA: ShlB/FhaC/HecB family hemolysin secretion/activation protein, partial [Methylibium sp.]|uniref:ShlB/FhaC/HecB family hemolysin secretion/activation protein n=1 Tax=Methylibium sp. TaxID=2067992 RepID=UPI002DB91E2B